MEIDFDEVHANFSRRINELIEEQPGPKKIEGIYMKTGISVRQWSQLRNPKRPDWSNARTIIRMALTLDINPTWLLLGIGHRKASTERNHYLQYEKLRVIFETSKTRALTARTQQALLNAVREAITDLFSADYLANRDK